MGQSSETGGLLSENHRRESCRSPTNVGERTVTFLRARYPERTAETVAGDLRHWPADTIAKMLERQSTPSGRLLLALIVAYGPEFACAVLDTAPAWLDAARRREAAAVLDAEIEALRRRREAL